MDISQLGASDFGYRKDASTAFSDFKQLELRLQAVHTGDVDLRPYCTETNQYSLSSCAGNATADSVEILNAIEGRPPVQLSRLFVYTLARNMVDEDHDGKGDINIDRGSYIRLCFKVLEQFGICSENLWPYDLGKVSTLPSLMAMREATGHRIHASYKITDTGDDRINAVLTALRANHPVVFGTTVGDSFSNVTSLDPVGIPSDGRGGHAMIIVGYLTGLGFLIKNSWGADWGDNGFCVMKPEYITWDETGDLWVPTRGSTFTG